MSACFWPIEIPVACIFRGLSCAAEELPAFVAVLCSAAPCAFSTWSAAEADSPNGAFVRREGVILFFCFLKKKKERKKAKKYGRAVM
jgi:predicted permease